MDETRLDSVERSLTEVDIQEFIEIYKKIFKEEISLKDGREMATRVLELYAALARPLPSEKIAGFGKTKSIDLSIKSALPRVQFSSPLLTKVIDILA